jgi:ABC-type uncharacterized transport system YnjBCD permease subunit
VPEVEVVEKNKIQMFSIISVSLTVIDVIITYGGNVPELLHCVHTS